MNRFRGPIDFAILKILEVLYARTMLGFVLHLLGSELWLCFAAMSDTEQLISFDAFVDVGVA